MKLKYLTLDPSNKKEFFLTIIFLSYIFSVIRSLIFQGLSFFFISPLLLIDLLIYLIPYLSILYIILLKYKSYGILAIASWIIALEFFYQTSIPSSSGYTERAGGHMIYLDGFLTSYGYFYMLFNPPFYFALIFSFMFLKSKFGGLRKF